MPQKNPRLTNTVMTVAIVLLSYFFAQGGCSGLSTDDGIADNGTDVTFSSARTISSTVPDARTVTVADLDRDGDPDVITLFSSRIAWHENLGGSATSWQQRLISNGVSDTPESYLQAVDMNSNVQMDVFAPCGSDNLLCWFENENGDGSLWAEQRISSVPVTHAVPARIDGDADLDTFVARQSLGLQWFENRSEDTLSWISRDIFLESSPFFIAAADIDGDTDLDLIAASMTGTAVTWHENIDSGTSWTRRTIYTSASGVSRVYHADIDRDGDLDVISVSPGNGVRWHENTDGIGTAWDDHLITGETWDTVLSLGDIDRDGDIDIVAGTDNTGRVEWFENTSGNGSAWARRHIANLAGVSFVLLADLNEDGRLDVVALSRSAGIAVWYEQQ
ncbi:MAG: FG-GAP repeat domain-containing protein [Desulfovibrionales bacterium]